ncbi:MAG: hypothetical protein JO295_03680 [Verrucomicrobia bacterium]|nr:hypothetical protein [Verrucomicrobiota bacterium]
MSTAPLTIAPGDLGYGPVKGDAECRRWEHIEVEVISVHGPVLRVRARTSWDRTWRRTEIMASDFDRAKLDA